MSKNTEKSKKKTGIIPYNEPYVKSRPLKKHSTLPGEPEMIRLNREEVVRHSGKPQTGTHYANDGMALCWNTLMSHT